MVGLTLGYSVFICRGHETARLLSHEFRHVYQHEQAGSIAAFLPGYLLQIVEHGYAATAFEIGRCAHELARQLRWCVPADEHRRGLGVDQSTGPQDHPRDEATDARRVTPMSNKRINLMRQKWPSALEPGGAQVIRLTLD